MFTFVSLIYEIHRHLHMNKIQNWDRGFKPQLPSLVLLDITGNVNWSIPEEFLTLPMLREIKGASLGKGCTHCSLIKNYKTTAYQSIDYLPKYGYILRNNSCLQRNFVLEKSHLKLPRNRFFPQCIIANETCHANIGRYENRNICIDLGAPILAASYPIAVLAAALDVVILIVIFSTKYLRNKPSMILVAALATSDLLLCTFALSIATVYQVIDADNFDTIKQICPSLSFLLTMGFLSTTHVSFFITIERYLVIVYPFKPNWHMRIRSTLLRLSGSTVFALAVSTWALFIPGIHDNSVICIPFNGLQTGQSFAFSLLALFSSSLVYMVTIALYYRIYVVTRRSSARVGRHRDAKLVRRIGLVVGTNLVLSFLPPFSITLMRLVAGEHRFGSDGWIVGGVYVPVMLAGLNSLANPFLYAFRNRDFKKALRQRWKQLRPKTTRGENSKQTVPVVIVNFRKSSI